MRRIILDADPGADEALAVALALFDPNVEIVAATSVGGCVEPGVAARNMRRIVQFLDPPRLPRLGVGTAPDEGFPFDSFDKSDNSGFYDSFAVSGAKSGAADSARPQSGLRRSNALDEIGLPDVDRRAPRSAEKTICEAVRLYPRETSILALGPLTNVARAFRLDPELPFLLNRLVVAGGVFAAPGDVAPCAEFNIFCDPISARRVLRAPCAKTLVPLDVSARFRFSFDNLAQLDAGSADVGRFVRRLFLSAFRERRNFNETEDVYLQGLISYFVLVEPSCFSTIEAAGDVEICGELTRGATVFDRRSPRVWRRNMEVVCDVDAESIRRKILDGLNRCVRQARSRKK